MGNKKGNQQPRSSRKAFKQSADYKKPQSVGTHEKAGGRYRQKLRARQAEARAGIN